MTAPLKDGAEAQIEFDIKFGGSKPPPYRVGYIFKLHNANINEKTITM